MEYRRSFLPGGKFFFTVVTGGRKPFLAEQENVSILREALRRIQSQRPFTIEAAVILPDHLHCIWTLPPGDSDFSTRWRLIKTWFTKRCDLARSGYATLTRPTPAQIGEIKTSQSEVWQHRFWEPVLRDETDYRRHVDYIHYNPVKHGYVKAPLDWPYSSFRRYVKAGTYPQDWGSDVALLDAVGKE